MQLGALHNAIYAEAAAVNRLLEDARTCLRREDAAAVAREIRAYLGPGGGWEQPSGTAPATVLMREITEEEDALENIIRGLAAIAAAGPHPDGPSSLPESNLCASTAILLLLHTVGPLLVPVCCRSSRVTGYVRARRNYTARELQRASVSRLAACQPKLPEARHPLPLASERGVNVVSRIFHARLPSTSQLSSTCLLHLQVQFLIIKLMAGMVLFVFPLMCANSRLALRYNSSVSSTFPHAQWKKTVPTGSFC